MQNMTPSRSMACYQPSENPMTVSTIMKTEWFVCKCLGNTAVMHVKLITKYLK